MPASRTGGATPAIPAGEDTGADARSGSLTRRKFNWLALAWMGPESILKDRHLALERAKVTLGDDGQLVVDKSRRFLWEKGEWSNPDAFLKL